MRIIIRFSLNKDKGSALRNDLKAILEAQGIMWTGRTTGTYEGEVSETEVRNALRRFWNRASGETGRAKVDHFWMYADRHVTQRILNLSEP